MNKMKLTEVFSIVSQEEEKFKKRLSKVILGRKVADIASKALNKCNSAFECENVKNLITDHFMKNVSSTLYPKLINSLENGGAGSNFIEEVGSLINKYVKQEASYRSNKLRVKYGVESDDIYENDRKAIVEDIEAQFRVDELSLELSESMTEEYDSLLSSEEEDIVKAAADSVKDSIEDAEEKAEVTRVIITEFKKVSEEIKEQQEAQRPDTDIAEEALKFNSTEFIKQRIPVTAQRFQLESDKGTFTKKFIMDTILSIEELSTDPKMDEEFIRRRIKQIYTDAVDVKDFDTSKVKNFEDLFDNALKEVDTLFSAYRVIGFGKGDLPSMKTDGDTLEVIKKMADLTVKDGEKRVNDTVLLIQGDVKEITSAEEMLQLSFENFEIQSIDPDKIPNYEQYRSAIELRNEEINNFMVDGMQHVPAARAERLKEINSGLRRLSSINAVEYMKSQRLKSIYYKTAKIASPEVFVDFKAASDEVKEMIKSNYNPDKYDSVVDDFFDETKRNKTHISEENLYEAFAYKSAMDISKENGGQIDIEGKQKVKTYAAFFSTYMKTLECLGIVDKNYIKSTVKSIVK